MRYYFEWDPAKANQNILEHKVRFQRAAEVFKDPHAISIFDEEHSQDEDRWITIGKDNIGTLLVISHTFRKIEENRTEFGLSHHERRQRVKENNMRSDIYETRI